MTQTSRTWDDEHIGSSQAVPPCRRWSAAVTNLEQGHNAGRERGTVKLTRMRVCNFQCFGPDAVAINLEAATFLLGPNGTGKTAFLHALCRMFGAEPSRRAIVANDFHVPHGERPGVGTARALWLEAEFEFPELAEVAADDEDQDDAEAPEPGEWHPTVPPHFAHMRLVDGDDTAIPRLRFRLTAELDINGEVSESLEYVLAADAADVPVQTAGVSRFDRRHIEVHYVPARRNPADHVSYAANALLGRLLRAADWGDQRDVVTALGAQVSATLGANSAVSQLGLHLAQQWRSVHTGTYFSQPGVSFLQGEVEGLLRHVTVDFKPGPAQPQVDFALLSDGQQSLLYLSLVISMHEIGREVLAGRLASFDVDRLRPPVFTLLAFEEPENSLSPHLLGRVLGVLEKFAAGHDGQVVVATHAPSLMRRVKPEQVRYLRLGSGRRTTVAQVQMPDGADEAHKFVREALHAYPELYFARLVVLGEGDSEEVVLPRCLQALELSADTSGVSVAPLGGRHVNHFWRLLHGLGIPTVTLLDLDLGRYQGGWGRIRYAASQLLKYAPSGGSLTQAHVDAIPAWNGEEDVRGERGRKWLAFLETQGVFFSNPLDLDFAMLRQFSGAFAVTAEEQADPEEDRIVAVLGKSHGNVASYSESERKLFGAYHRLFKLGSKPARHLAALAELDEATLAAAMPQELSRLSAHVRHTLNGLSE